MRRRRSRWSTSGDRRRRRQPGGDAHRRATSDGRDRAGAVASARASSSSTSRPPSSTPTASRGSFERMRALQAQGVTFLYISHHLEEIYEICDTVTVFRDARHIVTAPVADLSTDDLVAAMTGEAAILQADDYVTQVRAGRSSAEGRGPHERGALLRHVVGGSPRRGDRHHGQRQQRAHCPRRDHRRARARPTRARLWSTAFDPNPGDVASALHAGVGFVPRDRHREGLVELLSVAENLTMTITDRLGKWGFIHPGRRDTVARTTMKSLSLVASGPEQLAGSLSGGNQQKLVMGRALASKPALLVLMHPTAGVDVRSKATLISVVDQVRTSGTAVIIVSDELDDLRPCDRVLVMLHGKVTVEFPRGWTDADVVAATEGIGSAS